MKSRLTTESKLVARMILAIVYCIFYSYSFSQINLEKVNLVRRLVIDKEDTGKVEDLLALARNYIWTRPQQKIGLDSAEFLINQSLALSKNLNYIKGIGESIQTQAGLVQVKGNKQEAIKVYNTAIDIFKKSRLVENQAKVYLELAYMTGNAGKNILDKIDYLKKSLSLYKQINSKKDIGRVLQELADISQIQRKYDTAITLSDQALTAYNDAGVKDLQQLYSIYSSAYFAKSDFTQALKYGLLAAKTAESLNDTSEQLVSIYVKIGNVYNYSRDPNQAVYWFEKGRNVSAILKDTESIASINICIAEAWVNSRKFNESTELLLRTIQRFPPKLFATKVRLNLFLLASYLFNGQPNKAAKYYNQMVKWYDSLPKNNFNIEEISVGIIGYLHETKQYKRAYPFMDEYRKRAQQYNSLMMLINSEDFYFSADTATGNFREALDHYKLKMIYTDSLNGIERVKQMNDLEVKYETEKKIKEIQSLTYNNQLKDISLNKENTTKRLIIGIAILLFLLLIVIYSRYLLKERSTKRLKLQQDKINQQNEELKKLINDKEWLLKEIHHRVKNNLQIVISLLNTQSAYLDNAAALEAIQNSQHRMYAMSLIHQKLYQSGNMSYIDMDWYIKEMVIYLKDCFDINNTIRFEVDVDSVQVDIAQAVPLGLILNEAITNTVKYAFPNERSGTIKVMLKRADEDLCQLTVSDNGIGLPQGFNIQESTSLGMSLMYGLSEQLGGTLKLVSENGTTLHIEFKVNSLFINMQAA